MSDIKRVGDSGIHTVEGAVAGHKAALLSQQREKQQLEYEATKNKIKQENSSGVSRIDDKFSRSIETGEQVFRQKTIGLVTLDEFREARTVANNIIVDSKAENCLKESLQKEEEEKKLLKKQKELLSKKKMKQSLSFMQDDDDENSDSNAETEVDFVLNKKRNATCTTNTDNNSSSTLTFTNENKKMKKNPDVNTSFLPDKARDEFLEQERVRLKNEWIDKQERIKKEYLMVTYSYWDGGGHRKEVKIQKGYTIGKFLTVVKETLTKEFPELRGVSSDSLLYIKEDLIIPHQFTFYDLIISKARGKSGPLFHFDVHEDVRLLHDATIEKDESHPGKVVDRHWYEKNKHIFPASRWETYDPNKRFDSYSIHG